MRRGMDLVRCYRVCHRAISEYSLACETAIIANVAADEDWTYLAKSSYRPTEKLVIFASSLHFCMRGHAMCHSDENTAPGLTSGFTLSCVPRYPHAFGLSVNQSGSLLRGSDSSGIVIAISSREYTSR